ncbi:MAG: hypothetical protein ACRCWQ_08855, partial [Bacilli bacterium]
ARQLRFPVGRPCASSSRENCSCGVTRFRLIPRESPLPFSVPFIDVLMIALKPFHTLGCEKGSLAFMIMFYEDNWDTRIFV